jgi:hypothetical protein
MQRKQLYHVRIDDRIPHIQRSLSRRDRRDHEQLTR